MCVRVSCVKVVPGPGWDSRDGLEHCGNPAGLVTESGRLDVSEKELHSQRTGRRTNSSSRDLMFIFLPLGPDGDRLSSQV